MFVMSLFPAYSGEGGAGNGSNPKQTSSNNPEWLENSSFNIDVIPLELTAKPDKPAHIRKKVFSSESEEEEPPKKTKQRRVEKEPQEPEEWTIERKGSKEFFNVKTISRPAVPKYVVKFRILGNNNTRHRKLKFKRYYQAIWSEVKPDKDDKLTKKDLEKGPNADRNDNYTGFKQEEDLSKATATFNRTLTMKPDDVETWLKYVAFQDEVFQFEKSYRKGSMAKGQRVTADRKLAILEKALSQNTNSEKLQRERLNVAVSAFPADELYSYLENLIQKDQGNIILWQGLIESRQCSMSHCTTPKVLELYSDCLAILHKLRRNAQLEKAVLEENILRMLYQCGLFMKQAGLFERLWKLLSMYLDLNVYQNKLQSADLSIHEQQLEDLEEVVLSSNLPLHELWLRIEKLRECFHWLPYDKNKDHEQTCEDLQRVVFNEDVRELIHPITIPGNLFKLTATVLTLLKVPLLPCRHNTMQSLGIDYVPWALDSVEFILPVFYPMHGVDTSNKHLLKYTQKLAVGPQYLKTLPCQEEYLQFVLRIMKTCAESLTGNDQTALTVWWFRFVRLLFLLDKSGDFRMSAAFKKSLKAGVKALLAKEENRSNSIFFEEFAALECEQGRLEAAVGTLTKIIALNFRNKSVLDLKTEPEQASMSHLYRSLVEIRIKNNDKQTCLHYLLCFVLGTSVDEDEENKLITQTSVDEAALKFKHTYLLMLEKDLGSAITIAGHFLPHFFADFIVCYGWFLYLTQGAVKCGAMLQETVDAVGERYKESIWVVEVVYEFYVAVLLRNCMETCGMFGLLDDVLQRAIAVFPNNLFLLAILLKKQSLNCVVGQPWWRMKGLILKTGHALPVLFLLLVANEKMVTLQEKVRDSVTGEF